MDITNLEVECDKDCVVKVWAKCQTPDDIEDIIAWLKLAKKKNLMIGWDKIRNAKAPHPTKATPSKNEADERRKVQRAAQIEGGANGKRSSEATSGTKP